MDANHRPHQLFLTGDQIYADDVVHRDGEHAQHPRQRADRDGRDAADCAGRRRPTRRARSSISGRRSRPGFPTIAAFVDVKRAAGLDPLAELKKDRRVRAQADPCFDHRFKLLYEGTYNDRCRDARRRPAALARRPQALPGRPARAGADVRDQVLDHRPREPPDLARRVLRDVHRRVVERGLAGEPARAAAVPAARAALRAPGRRRLAALGPARPASRARASSATTRSSSRPSTRSAKRGRRAAPTRAASNTLTTFFDGLPRVRRALANVPTYMVFDDHDVTDDWNIVRAWRDQVHTTPLGRRIITDALVAYAVFQDWGNDPLKLPHRRLPQAARRGGQALPRRHRAARGLRRAGQALRPQPRRPGGARAGLQPPPPKPDPTIKWHWSIDGPHHRVIALDTRTRRQFRSRHRPAALLSPQALEEQLPDPATQAAPAGRRRAWS